MRLGECYETRNAAFAREFMPDRPDGLEAEVRDDAVEDRAQQRLVAQCLGATARGLDQPFGPNVHRFKAKR